jgi:hypothetical protein
MEILPKPAGGDTAIDLDWLAVFVGERSSSHFWACWLIRDVAYYNEARILDPRDTPTPEHSWRRPIVSALFVVVGILLICVLVLAGRTYPLEGKLVLLN